MYTEEIFNSVWRDENKYKLSGTPEITSYDECKEISEVKIWETLYYEPGGVGVYLAHNPKCDLLIIVHEFFIEHNELIECYNVSKDFLNIVNRLDDLEIRVIDRILHQK